MKRVLVVDDSALIVTQLTDTLINLKYEVPGSAASGLEAIEKAKRLCPDIVIMDVVMPGPIDGIEAARQIRNELNIPVVLLTGYENERLIELIKEVPVDGYVMKPVRSLELKASIEIALVKRESERRFRDLYREVVEKTGDLVYVVDGEGEIKYINGQIAKLVGITKEDAIGKNFSQFLTPASLMHSAEIFRRYLKGEDVGLFELEITNKNGNVHVIEMSEQLVWEQGRIVELHGIGRDVTERKRAEEAIRKSEELMRVILQTTAVGMCYAEDRKIFWINPMMQKLFGFTRTEDYSGRDTKILYASDEEYERMGKLAYDVFPHGKIVESEVVLKRKNGTEFIGHMRLCSIDPSHPRQGIVASFEDITERKRAEEELRKSEEKYRKIFNNAIEGMYQTTPNGRFISVNPAFARILGYSSPEEIIREITDIRTQIYVRPDDRQLLKELVEKNDIIEGFQTRFRRKDGEEIWVSFSTSAVRNEDGRLLHFEGTLVDITEEKKAREEILYLKEFNENIINNMNDLIDIVDEDYTIVFQNKASKKKYGQNVGKKCHNAYHNKDIPCNYCTAVDAIREKTCFSRDVLLEDGTYLEVHSSPIRMPDGTYCSMEIMRDITRRKRMEEELRVSEERYRALYENNPSMYFTVDEDGTVLSVNPYGAEQLGFAVDELVGRPVLRIFHEEDRDRVTEQLKECVKKREQVVHWEFRKVRKDGGIMWVREAARAVCQADGRLVVLIVCEDITDQKRAEEALKESEAKFRGVFETSRDFMYISSIDGAIIDYNATAKEFFGFTDKEIKKMTMLEVYHNPEDRTKLIEKLTEEGSVQNYELKLKKKDGSVFDALVTIAVRRDGDGRVVGFQGAVKDITQMKQMERQLQQVEKLSGLGTMISGIAHELNNPLTAIMGNAELLAMKENITDREKKSFDIILQESARAAKIVNGLLTFAREHKSQRRVVNINDVVKESLGLRENNLRVNDIAVELHLSDDAPPTLADPYQLQQVFINIINNASDALMDVGGGKLVITTERGQRKLRVVFEDNGPGIDAENLKRLFDPFFTTKEVGKGTGLGLSIAYGIIGEHHGKIQVDSEPGRGARFTVELPIFRGKETGFTEETEHTGGESYGKSILIVDDEASVRDFLSDLLTREGYTVRTASTGRDAVSLMSNTPFDAVVADIRMPGMDGMELYGHILKNYPAASKRMLFITGDTLSEEIRVFLRTSNTNAIAKPFTTEQFLTGLNRLFEVQ